MDTAASYLEKTRSSVEHLLSGIRTYVAILREKKVPGIVFDCESRDEEAIQKELKRRSAESEAAVAERKEVEERYFAESFAQANLCGALLQVAYMGISLYGSPQTEVKLRGKVLGDKYARFYVGRPIRSLPQGLLVLAGRNQYMHLEAEELRFPNDEIFDILATHNIRGQRVLYRDPAFELSNKYVVSFSSNITAAMNWRSYEAYEADMKVLLNV